MSVLRISVAALLATVLLGGPATPALQAQTTGTIEGRVVDRLELPVGDVAVQMVGTRRRATTDRHGVFTFEGVPAGALYLQISDPRRGEGTARVEVTAGETARVEIELTTLFHLDAIVVSAGPLAARQDDLFQAASVVESDRLRERLQPSLGETLANEPGVSSTYFGPGASRPVIRGLGGDRVRILESGIGTGDAANTSPDHAVSIDPASAERIEIVRGPATLLYGSQAVGGVVNVFDGRIPTRLPERTVTGGLTALAATVADERNLAGNASVAAGRLVFRASGSVLETGDYSIPGAAELEHEDEAHADESPEEGEDHADEVEGLLENSAVQNSAFGVGASFVGERGFLGISTSGVDNLYGVPGGHGAHGEEAGEEGVRIDLRQRRVDLSGELRFDGGLIEQLRLRAGRSDYRHVELEGEEIGTRFENDQWEGRLEVRHRSVGVLTGAVGAQLRRRDFSAVGEEAFTPPSLTEQVAIFAFEEARFGPVRAQLGGRMEWQRTEAESIGRTRAFDAVSVSAGLNWEVSELLSVAVTGARSVKLPTPEELFSDGPHLATNAWEVGDPNLTEEVAASLDATLHFHQDEFRGQLTLFLTDFSDYIYPAFTGGEREGLREIVYGQADARLSGFEAMAESEIIHAGDLHIGLEVSADYVRGTLTSDDTRLPRMPPLRFGGALTFDATPLRARIGARYIAAQDQTAPFEEETPSYANFDASVSYRFFRGGLVHELILQGRNLADTDQRNHISLLKEVAPMPGRDLRLMYRLAF